MKVCNPEKEPLCPNTLRFDAESHTYYRTDGGKNKLCCSATTFIKYLMPEFDAETKALETAERKRIYNAEGLPDGEKVQNEWKEKGRRAADFGTLFHNSLEYYLYTGNITHYIDNIFSEKESPESKSLREGDKDNIRKYLVDNESELTKLIYPNSISVKERENLIFYPEHRLTFKNKENFLCPYLSGTADLVILHGDGKTVSIGDYKTNENVFKKPYNDMYFGFGGAPFYLKDSPIDKYTIQLNVYASMIKSYGFDIGELFIIWAPSTLDKEPVRVNVSNYINDKRYSSFFKENFRDSYLNLLTVEPKYNQHERKSK